MNLKKKFFLGKLFLLTAFSANAEKIPDDLAKIISEKNANSKVLASTSCQVGSTKTPAVGFLIQKPGNKNPLAIYMATMQNQTWYLFPIPTDVNHPRGAVSDILEDFWDDRKGLIGPPYGILCTELPNSKESIGKKHKGIYDKPFTEKNQSSQKHLCFPASGMYNSFVCYVLNEKNGQPQRVFTQFNVD